MKIDETGGGLTGRFAGHSGRLKIALLSYRSDPKVGGQGIFVRNVSAALLRRGHCVTVVSGPPYPDLAEGVDLVELPSLDLFAQPRLGRLALRPRHLLSWTDTREFFGHHSGKFMEPSTFGARAARFITRNRAQFDVVLDNQTLADGLLEIQRKIPLTTIVHHPIHHDRDLAVASQTKWGDRALTRRWYSFLTMQERVAPQLRSIVTVSAASASDIADKLGADPRAISVVYPGIDRTHFHQYPDVERLPLRIVSTASADVPLKGLRYLIEGFVRIAPSLPEAELVLVGHLRKGPTADLIAAAGLGQRIRFVHSLSTRALAELYASAALYVAPSLYEGFGLPVAEAMACGTPVLVTDGGALPEVVGDAGMVVPRADASALADAMADLLADSARRDAMAARGLARVEAAFCWDRLAERYEAIFLQQLATAC